MNKPFLSKPISWLHLGVSCAALLGVLSSVARAQTASITVNSTDSGAVNKLTWGVNAPDRFVGWVNNTNFVTSISNAGIKLIRVNPIPQCLQDGQDPNPSAGTYNWTEMDSILNTVFNAGAQPLFVVCGFPAATGNPVDPTTHRINTSYSWTNYATFMQAVVNRYNVQKVLGATKTIKYWEMWNEPTIEGLGIMGDNPNFTGGGWPTNNYPNFVQTVGGAMKTTDSTISLLGPVDSHAGLGANEYLAYTAQNLSAQIDILSWHNYGTSTSDQARMDGTPQAYKTDPTNVTAGGTGSIFVGPGNKHYGTAITEYNLCSASFGSDAKFGNEYNSAFTGSAIINAMLGNVNLFTFYAAAESGPEASGSNLLGLLHNTDFSIKAKAYYVFQLFGTQFSKGDRKLTTSGAANPIEAVASFSSTTGKRYLAVVNKHLTSSYTVTFTINGVGTSGGTRTVWLVDSANNATTSSASYTGSSFAYTLSPRGFAVFEVTPTTGGGGSTLFTTGFETGDTQPTWLDTVAASSNVTGYTVGVNPECSPRDVAGDGGGLTAHAGSKAEMFSGTDNSTTTSYCNCKVFNVNIPVTASTKMSYWILPQQANGRYVGVDYHCTDGSTLRDSGATDQNGFAMHPNAGHGGSITLNAWTQIKCNVGQWLAGKTIDTIYISYDHPASTGQYRGYIDDILITNGTLP